MSRMSEMSTCIAKLKSAATALLSVAETLASLYSGEESVADKPVSKSITKEDVRSELAAKSAAGYGTQVRALLKKHGAVQLSAVDPADYADLLLEAQAIGNEVDTDV